MDRMCNHFADPALFLAIVARHIARSAWRIDDHHVPLDDAVPIANRGVEGGSEIVGPAAVGGGREDIVAQGDQRELAALDARHEGTLVPLAGARREGE